MFSVEWVGFLAGLLVNGSTIPQIIRVFKLKSAREISLLFTTMLFLGVSCWFAYGLWLGLVSLIVWNAIAIVLVGILLFAKLKYGR